MSIILEAVKESYAFDYSKGDRISISSSFLRDKKKLDPKVRADLQRLLRTWQRRKGVDFPIFEFKNRKKYPMNLGDKRGLVGVCMAQYGIELRKRVPPVHINVFITDTNPNYGNPKTPNPKGKLFIFDRIFDNYDKYNKYINDHFAWC